MLDCPQCHASTGFTVLETRKGGEGISRRRSCKTCGYVFHTVEQVSGEGMRVRKVDGRVVPFAADSIHESLAEAAAPGLGEAQVRKITELVVRDLHPMAKDGPIPTADVADAVLAQLRQVDPVTHIRFALAHVGRKGRQDGQSGWDTVDEVRAWLAHEYPRVREEPMPAPLSVVIKRDGRRVRFDRSKMEAGIQIAANGRGSLDEVETLARDTVEDVIAEIGSQPVVTSGQIAAGILRSLRARDPVAYLRFAAIVKHFSTPLEYEAEALTLRPNHHAPVR
jgi:transcriptional repressor NrdR